MGEVLGLSTIYATVMMHMAVLGTDFVVEDRMAEVNIIWIREKAILEYHLQPSKYENKSNG